MKATVYTIEDDYLGILLTIEGEVITFADEDCPDVIINEIAYRDKTLELWPFSDKFIEYLKDRIYQTWANEAHVGRHSPRRYHPKQQENKHERFCSHMGSEIVGIRSENP